MAPLFYATSQNGAIQTVSKFDGTTRLFTKNITGLAAGYLVAGIDIRPANGILYALAIDNAPRLSLQSIVYELDAEANPNAVASNPRGLTNSMGGGLVVFSFLSSIDFNPTNNLLRVIESFTGRNAEVNVNTGVVTFQGNINPAVTTVYGCAYSNNINPSPGTTTLYDLGNSSSTNRLFTQVPITGTTSIVGPLTYQTPFPNPPYVELDILTTPSLQNFAYALSIEQINNVDVNNLYSIDLVTPSATLIGPINTLSNANLLTGFALINPATPCLHPDTLVQTPNDKKVRIDSLRAGDQVMDYDGKTQTLVNNIRFQPSTTFYKIRSNALGKNVPSKDLLIREGHPILYKGQEVEAKKLRKILGGKKIHRVKLDSSVPVWSLCTKERTFIMMENIPVATWSSSDIDNIAKYSFTRF